MTVQGKFKRHILSRDDFVEFDSSQSEKATNMRIVILALATIWVRFTWRGLRVCARFLQPWQANRNVVLTPLCFHMLYLCCYTHVQRAWFLGNC